MYNNYRTGLFSSEELREFLLGELDSVRQRIERLKDSELAADTRAEVVSSVFSSNVVRPVVLDVAGKTLDWKETKIQQRNDWNGRVLYVDGVEVTVKIPFSGNSRLLRMQPSRYRISGVSRGAQAQGQFIVLRETFVGVPTQEQVKGWFDRAVEDLEFHVGVQGEDIAAHNAALGTLIPEMVDRRLERLDKLRGFGEGLSLDA